MNETEHMKMEQMIIADMIKQVAEAAKKDPQVMIRLKRELK